MVFVDGTIVNLTLAQLASHLPASRSALEWAVNAYTLSFAAVMLGAGAITDALGAKRAFVAGLLVFTASSAVCAAAPSMLVLNIARLVQGAGSALLLPSALVLSAPRRSRNAPDVSLCWASARPSWPPRSSRSRGPAPHPRSGRWRLPSFPPGSARDCLCPP